jgi:hypothetical protein
MTLQASRRMSALGQKLPSTWRTAMSAQRSKADVLSAKIDVSLVPESDIKN